MSSALEAQAMFQGEACTTGEGSAWHMVADVHLARSAIPLALEAAHKALAFYEKAFDKRMQAQAHKLISNIHIANTEYEDALQSALQALAVARQSLDNPTEIEMLLLVATMQATVFSAGHEGDSPSSQMHTKLADKAMRNAKDASLIAKKIGKKNLLASAMYTAAHVFFLTGRYAQAIAKGEEAARKFREFPEEPEGEVLCSCLLAEVHFCDGEFNLAREFAENSLSLARALGDQEGEERALRVIKKMEKPKAPVPETVSPEQAAQAEDTNAEAVAPAEEKKGLEREVVVTMVQATLLEALGTDEQVDLDTPLMEAGMDSLTMVAFRNMLQRDSGVSMPASVMFDYPTMAGLTDHLVEMSKL